MNDNGLRNTSNFFSKILEIESPWKLSDIELDQGKKTVKAYIDFERGSKFSCPVCSSESKVYDSQYRLWRHLDVIDYKLFLMIRIPRIHCSEHGVKTIKEIPWGRINSHFTHMFENSILHKASEMSVLAIAREVSEDDKTLWRIINHHIGMMRDEQINFKKLRTICVDETSSKKGHNYVTVFTNYENGKIQFVTEGKDMKTFEQFHNELRRNNVNYKNIQDISIDMSKSFIAGAGKYFPAAMLTFDKFHVEKLLNKAVDDGRKQERTENELLNRTKYIWLKSPSRLSSKQKEKLEELLKDSNSETAEAYRVKLNFKAVWGMNISTAEEYLKRWCENVKLLNLEPLNEFVRTLENHWQGIINITLTKISNGVAEGINSVIQLAKSRARGFTNIDNFINIIYLIGARFEF